MLQTRRTIEPRAYQSQRTVNDSSGRDSQGRDNLKFQKSKMVAAAILKNLKLRYLDNGLTDRQEIRHGIMTQFDTYDALHS